MSKSCVQIVFAVMGMFLSLLAAGCTSVAADVGEKAYTHLRGDLLAVVPDSLEEVYPAAVAAMESLEGYDVAEKNLNVIGGLVVAYDEQARKVRIELSKTENNQTAISIRIGAVGDKVESVRIYDSIQYYLRQNRTSKGVQYVL